MDKDILERLQNKFPHLSVETILDWNEAFKMFDQDKNGSISAKEVKQVLKALGQKPTTEEVKDIVNELDVNQDGSIQFEEFMTSMVRRNSIADPTGSTKNEDDENLRAAFNIFDTDKNGKIDMRELKNLLQTLGEDVDDEQLAEMMTIADLDKNGTIDFEEFKVFMQT